MVPVLAGYISYSIADRPGLVGGILATNLKAGFLGGIIAGFIAGYIARWIKSWKVPKSIRPIMPIFVIPLLSALTVGLIMIFVIGTPIANLMTSMTNGLTAMSAGSAVVLALIMGAMIAFDMGGPVNKVAFLFESGLIASGVYTVMGPVAVGWVMYN